MIFFFIVTEDAALAESGTTPKDIKCAQNLPIERRYSNGNCVLFDNLDVNEKREKYTGKFLTMHKRRRKRLITRSLNRDTGILDDVFHGQAQVNLYFTLLFFLIYTFTYLRYT